ncbi:unnamed protein product [Meganyctiphanes norvegica]|uniref:Ras GTPase-activating protein n=1 Tax=Meganyctiphanes norvegica TaxID=48144 RepID=A0AAV2QQN4_MEGNR
MEIIRKLGVDFPSFSSSLPSSISSALSVSPKSTSSFTPSLSSASTFYVSLDQNSQGPEVIPIRIEWLEDFLLDHEELFLDDPEEDDVFVDDVFGDVPAELGLISNPSRCFGYGPDTSYEKACGADRSWSRRGSAPAHAILAARPASDPPGSVTHSTGSTPSRIANFFSKRSQSKTSSATKRTSVTKLEKSGKHGIAQGLGVASGLIAGDTGNDAFTALSYPALGSNSCMQSSISHESLLSSQNNDTTDGEVSVTTTIRPLHSSILGQDFCFQVTSPIGTKYFSCRSVDERDRWIESLRKAINPSYEHIRRKENSLKIFILEAKGVVVKKRYFCELLIDDELYARTSSKSKSDMCFWGEQFEFHNLPAINTISIALFKESEKKRNKEKITEVGVVDIAVKDLLNQNQVEKWYPVQAENNKNSKDPPALRIKCKFQSVDILPLECYSDFLQFVLDHYVHICSILEPCISVKQKEDIATTLIHIMQHQNKSKEFLNDIVMAEIQGLEDAHLLFRGNSIATKAMEAFMKLVGAKYLLDTLQQAINRVVEEPLECEVDPMKLPQISSIQMQQDNLLSVVRMTWSRILNSHPYFPLELRECFCLFRERLTSTCNSDLFENLISASIFLRFICPAILSPSLFNLTQEYPVERASRNLTLIAKTLQTLANFTKFQGKENYMEFMNMFIEAEQLHMRTFLRQISSPLGHNNHKGLEYEGDIDLGKQMSILHTLLTEAIKKVNKESLTETNQHYLDILNTIFEDINVSKAQVTLRPGESDSVHEPCDVKNISRLNQTPVNDCSVRKSVPTPKQHQARCSESPKSVTLPRNAYPIDSPESSKLVPNASNDYVLYNALQNDQPRVRTPLAATQDRSGISNSHGNFAQNYQACYNNTHFLNDVEDDSNAASQSKNSNYNDSFNKKIERSVTDGTEINHSNSHIYMSQRSNSASSGCQSFTLSPSSSPAGCTKPSHLGAASPLVISNPMYLLNNMNPSESTPRPVPVCGVRQSLHLRQQLSNSLHSNRLHSSSFSSSYSIEDLTSISSVGKSLTSTHVQQGGHSSSSEDLSNTALTSPEVNDFVWPITYSPPLNRTPSGKYLSQSPHVQHKLTDKTSLSGSGIDSQGYESDSSSDSKQKIQKPRLRHNRQVNSRASAGTSKTLDEYEQEILALRTAMEEMHNNLMSADEVTEFGEMSTKNKAESSSFSNKSIASNNAPSILGNNINTECTVSKRDSSSQQHCRGGDISKKSPQKSNTQDANYSNILEKLLEVQKEFDLEKKKMTEIMYEKDAMIEAQKNRINDLDQTNIELRAALGKDKK